MDGVNYLTNKQMVFTRLERLTGSGGIHAEGRWVNKGETDADTEGRATVAVAFGPQYGPVTAMQVEELIRVTSRRGYDDLVVAGFSFDGPAQAVITEAQHPKLRIHIAHIRPDVNPGMAGLLKEQPGSQLFTVFGQPRTTLKGPSKQGEYTLIMEGVDIYDPVANTIRSTEDQKVAAWFLDGDYDGRCFCITQAFFPDKSAWEKLSKGLAAWSIPNALRHCRAPYRYRSRLESISAWRSRLSTLVATRSCRSTGWVNIMPEPKPNVPIQAVDKPIICPPYVEPNDHWLYDTTTGKASHAGKRRPASYWYKTERTGSAQLELFAEEERDDLPLVNLLRDDVRPLARSRLPWRLHRHQRIAPVLGQPEARTAIVFLPT